MERRGGSQPRCRGGFPCNNEIGRVWREGAGGESSDSIDGDSRNNGGTGGLEHDWNSFLFIQLGVFLVAVVDYTLV
jgi:hypothetical protein